MKKIEYFINRIAFTMSQIESIVFKMPYMTEKYCVIFSHQLLNILLFSFLLGIMLIILAFLRKSGMSVNENIFVVLTITLSAFMSFGISVYCQEYKGKYRMYYEQFEHENKEGKLGWIAITIITFLLSFSVLILGCKMFF